MVCRKLVYDLNILSRTKALLPPVGGHLHAFGFLLWFAFISLTCKLMMAATPQGHCGMGHHRNRADHGPYSAHGFRGTWRRLPSTSLNKSRNHPGIPLPGLPFDRRLAKRLLAREGTTKRISLNEFAGPKGNLSHIGLINPTLQPTDQKPSTSFLRHRN